MLRHLLGALGAHARPAPEARSIRDRQLDASFEQAATGIAHVALDGRWLRVNAQCCLITGYSREELLVGRFQQITHPDDLAQNMVHIESLLSGAAERYAMDKRYIRKDGRVVWVHHTVTLIRDESGAPGFFVVVIRDISDRKHVEANLVESEARYRAIFDSAAEAIAVTDPRGIIQSVNPAVERIFGYAPAELIGGNVRSLIPLWITAEDEARPQQDRAAGCQTNIDIAREVEGVRKDGAEIPIDLSVAEWERAGETFLANVMRDTSPRREAETALQTSETQLRLLQNEYAHIARVNEMGEMAAAIAHEINQPLTAIVNYLNAGLYAAAKGCTPGTFEEAQHVMAAASDQALRAGEIVRRLREFVGKGTGERHVEMIDTLIDVASGLALVEAAGKNIHVERRANAAGVEVCVDTVQIQQVIVNLLRNAIDSFATVPGQSKHRITIESGLIEHTDMVEIRIADNGPGIPDASRSSVFEPFSTSKPQGMGMGLSICRRLIEAHGGSIELEPSNGMGAAFRFELPQHKSIT